MRLDRAVVDDKGVLRRASWCARVGRQFTLSSVLKRKTPRHADAHNFDFWVASTDDLDHKRAGYTRFSAVVGLQGSQNFQQYRHIDRSLKPLLMRPSQVLVRKALDRMWFRRHWYWPSGYIVVGIIVALLTNNIHLSSLSGVLLSILAVLLWPFILGAALCRLLGFHIPGIDIT